MAFDSWQYGLFLAAVLLAFRMIRGRPGAFVPGLLLFASFIFYAYAGFLPMLLFGFSILVNQRLMEWMGTGTSPKRRQLLVVGLCYNVAYLFAFKYAAFFQGAWGSLGQWLDWWQPPQHVIALALPVGISFYTFESISILVDVYRRRYAPPNRADHALFVSFFPHLIAGPILRGSDLLPQIRALRDGVGRAHWQRGLAFLTLGLFKKAVLADTLGLYVDPVFGDPSAFACQRLWLAAYAFAFQIYFDFSAYTDMAEGSAALLGLRLAPNFRQPYAAISLSDFWRRWHISLSSWLRDYLYIPLGGSRHGQLRQSLALLVTMALGGLWHGANWTFVVWGCYHGLWLALERRIGWSAAPASADLALRRFCTFHAVLLGWVLFRAKSLGSAGDWLSQAIRGPLLVDSTDLLLAGALGFAWLFSRWEARWEEAAWSGKPVTVAPLWIAGALVATLAFKMAASELGRPFIYFRF